MVDLEIFPPFSYFDAPSNILAVEVVAQIPQSDPIFPELLDVNENSLYTAIHNWGPEGPFSKMNIIRIIISII